jgi:parallel beta-helix repeat protein
MILNGKSLVYFLQKKLFTISLLFMVLMLFFPMKGMSEGTGDYPPPINGDWIITSDTYVENENITIEGNITIQAQGKLTLDNVTLIINTSNYGYSKISVKNGGELKIINNSIIMQDDTLVNYDFIFENGSKGLIQNSMIRDCGWNDGGTWASTGGIMVISDDVIIESSTIQNNYMGIVVFSSSPSIKNNMISTNLKYGIFMVNSSAQIMSNEITFNPVGVYSLYSAFSMSRNEIRDNGEGIRIEYSNVSINGDNITSSSPEDCSTGTCSPTENGNGIFLKYSYLIMEGANISENVYDGLFSYSSWIEINNSIFANNRNGVLSEYSFANFTNNIFSNNELYGINWRYTNLDLDDSNLFTNNEGLGRIIMEWKVVFSALDEYGDRISNADIELVGNGTSYTSSIISGITDKTVAEYTVNNGGMYIGHNPYNITAKKIAPWDGIEYRNSTNIEIRDNLEIKLYIPLKKPDLRIDNISLSDKAKVNKKIKITVEVSNIGDTAAKDVQIIVTQRDSLGKTVVVDKTNISLDPNESVKLPITWVPEQEGDTLIKAVVKTSYEDRDKENNELETMIDIGEKEKPFYEEPYFMAGLISFIIIFMGIGIYTLALRKKGM